jgi:hypothetical protein
MLGDAKEKRGTWNNHFTLRKLTVLYILQKCLTCAPTISKNRIIIVHIYFGFAKLSYINKNDNLNGKNRT